MEYSIEDAVPKDAIKISSLLYTSLSNGADKNFKIDKERLLNHVIETIISANGFSIVLKNDDEVVGCFMGAITQHAYANVYQAAELGVYIEFKHRGSGNFEKMLDRFIEWSQMKPDICMTLFSIGQLNATTPYVRKQLKDRGFIKADESYYLMR